MNSLELVALLMISTLVPCVGLTFYAKHMVNRLCSLLLIEVESRKNPKVDLVHLRTALVALLILSVLTLLIAIFLYQQLSIADSIVSALEDLLSMLMTQ